jgi:hypothetical protein
MNIGGRGQGFKSNPAGINRTGRPAGAKGLLMKALKDRSSKWPLMLDKAIEIAMRGDVNMLTFLLGRLIPSAKQQDNTIKLSLPPDIKPGDLPRLSHEFALAMSRGEMSPDEFQKVNMGLAAVAAAQGQDNDTRQRLSSVERRIELRLGPRQIEGELSTALGGHRSDDGSMMEEARNGQDR